MARRSRHGGRGPAGVRQLTAYRLQGGPVINIQYRDIAFASTGEGIGVNFLRGDHYRLGAAISYDLGRRVKDDYTNLHGMGDIAPAPVAKLFGSYVLSRKFPLILRADVRQLLRGANGTVGDVGSRRPRDIRSSIRIPARTPSAWVSARLDSSRTTGCSIWTVRSTG
jgi:outer membrane scaffolding protein for murein synthesis (MipA/OmpV family)